MSTIRVDQQKLEAVKRALEAIGAEPNQAMVRAINRTLEGVGTDSAKAISAELNLTQATIKKNHKAFKASLARVTGKFQSQGRPIPLIKYGATQVRDGVSVRIKRGSPKKTIKFAFLATMKSGHKGVFQRTSPFVGAGRPIGNTGRLHMNAPGKWPRQYRLPIKELHGPRVEDIMSNTPVMTDILEKASQRLHDRLEHEADHIIRKAQNA